MLVFRPSLIAEDQAFRINLILSVYSQQATAGDVRAVTFAGHDTTVFKAELLGVAENPHRAIIDFEAVLGESPFLVVQK
jgi:hypothetical protein